MRIALGCDHRGFEGKRKLLPQLKKWGHEVRDFGCQNTAPCDYPDYAGAVASAVSSGEYDAGILLDGSGIGMSIAANKVVGARAARWFTMRSPRGWRGSTTTAMSCALGRT